MKTIWKFNLHITDEQSISIPSHHKILSVQLQNNILCLWALVDSNTERKNVIIDLFATGQPINRSIGNYINTVQIKALIFHVFERLEI